MRKKLLLADDSVTIQKVVGISFANEDIELVTVDNGDDAVVRAAEVRPDVVLADVVMPGKNGYEVCEALKNNPELSQVPVLLLTGTFEAFDGDRANRCGAAGHIAKPFEAQSLVDRVLELMANPPAAAPLAVDPRDGATVAIGRIGVSPPGSPPETGATAESFDFFDDSAGTAAPAAASLDVDAGDDAFAFAAEPASLPDSMPNVPAPPATPVPSAIRDTDPAGTMLMADDGLADIDEVVSAPMEPSEDTLARLVSTEAESADIFDFASSDSAAADPLATPGFGQETVLDPNGASGYDVYSSDLGSPPPVAPPEPESVDDLLWSESDDPMPPVGVTAPQVSDELPPLADLPPVVASDEPGADDFQAPAVATVIDESSLEDVAFAEAAWPASDAPSAEPVHAATPMPEPIPMPEPMPAAVPEPMPEPEEQRISMTHDTAAVAGMALSEIEPQLRESLHDTLEKIAWESLGDVAEQIISQAVERIERAAWEVIPQMAETLIREEIRRMKGE